MSSFEMLTTPPSLPPSLEVHLPGKQQPRWVLQYCYSVHKQYYYSTYDTVHILISSFPIWQLQNNITTLFAVTLILNIRWFVSLSPPPFPPHPFYAWHRRPIPHRRYTIPYHCSLIRHHHRPISSVKEATMTDVMVLQVKRGGGEISVVEWWRRRW